MEDMVMVLMLRKSRNEMATKVEDMGRRRRPRTPRQGQILRGLVSTQVEISIWTHSIQHNIHHGTQAQVSRVRKGSQEGVYIKLLVSANMQARKAQPESDIEDEEAAFAANSTLNDPMIDEQVSDDDSDDDDENEDVDEEMDEDDGVEEFGDEPAQPAAAGPSRSRNLYAAPTLAELDELRAAEASGGNKFSLQLDELLKSTLLPTTPAPALKTLLGAVHDLVHAIPTLPAVAPRKAASRLKGTPIPFPGPKELSPIKGDVAVQWTLGFEAPAEVVVAGSWAVCGGYKKAKGQAGNVDVVVVMPQTMFSPKDRMAYRYFHKRAHYLAVIADALKKASKKTESPLHGVEIEWEHADDRRPIISIAAGKGEFLGTNCFS